MTLRNRVGRLEDIRPDDRDRLEIVVLLTASPDRPPGRNLDWAGRRLTVVSEPGKPLNLPGGRYKIYSGIDLTELV